MDSKPLASRNISQMTGDTTFSIWQLDAFTGVSFRGNPAAVVAIDGAWPSDDLLQAIAAENNLSETAFFRLAEYPVPLRWFTPNVEVPLCGHATLATIAVMHKALGLVSDGAVVELATASGSLHVSVNADDYVLDLPARPITSTSISKAQLEAVLQTNIQEVWESVDRYVCVLEDEAAVSAVKPDLMAVMRLPLPGLIVTAAGSDCDFVSRYFAPAKGVPEDPVTGTSHCTLAPFWGRRLGKADLDARQLSHRGGQVACFVRADRVRLSGSCKLYLTGSIVVPAVMPAEA
ncbi:phenazine biosynthesis protein PhzF family [Variovorax sp. EL159]|nr:phenazine biosynthesis protein PhzF family [Variovorax sp. EL159]